MDILYDDVKTLINITFCIVHDKIFYDTGITIIILV